MMASQKFCHKTMGDGIADDGQSMSAIIKIKNNNHEKIWLINKRKNDDIHEKQ